MTPQQVSDFLKEMGWSQATLGRMLGKDAQTINSYATKGVPKTMRGLVSLACLALKHGHRAGDLDK
jgi:ribosome-binding protein aMBF1 (putative translation factor)